MPAFSRPKTTGWPACWLLAAGTTCAPGARDWPRRSRYSTRPPSPPRTVSAIWCWPGWACRAGSAPGAALIEDASDTVEEVVDDLYLRRVLGWGTPPFDRKTALEIARTAVANPVTALEPDPDDSTPGRQSRLAESVRREVARRLLDRNLLTYDDLLVRLKDTLADESRGDTACRLLRDRYRVVLVDEFQDTDPVQWEVVRRAFGDGKTILVLIGDPKQAIYAFRGADVFAYLDAARVADHRFTLSENWRSDEDLLTAFDALLSPLRVGHPDIPYRKVRAAATHRHPGLRGAPTGAPLRARVLFADDRLVPRTSKGVQKEAAMAWVAGDLAADVVKLLSSQACIVDGSDTGDRGRPVSAGDVAALVRTNRQAILVQSALRAAGVPAVVGGTESVFASPSAAYWLRLLEALEQPASRPRAVAVALTPFIGMTAAQVAGAGEATWEALHARLHHWAELLRSRGVAILTRAILAAEALPARLLLEETGERDLTDLGHIAELLHAEGSTSQLGPPALRTWLARRTQDAGTEALDGEDRSRRLDSDADAVQVLTIHRAKGLEFPVVYCPYLWDNGMTLRRGRPLVFHDAATGNRRTLDVGVAGSSAGYDAHFRAAQDEQRGEDLRLLYVALTRARHQAVIWWVRAYESQQSPLGRLLMCRDAQGNVASSATYASRDQVVQRQLEAVAATAPALISIERCQQYSDSRWMRRTPPTGNLAAARFGRSLDRTWRRTSYSGITAPDQDGELVGSEPESPGITDEPQGAPAGAVVDPGASLWAAPGRATDGNETRLRAVSSSLAGVPRGADVGIFVHGVLERVDFAALDLPAAVSAAIAAEQSSRPLEAISPDQLRDGLVAAISTPLGPLVGGRSLRAFGPLDRLDELRFELPLVGGDQSRGTVLTADLARLFSTHVTDGEALNGYAIRLGSPALATRLRGYLTGSLDLVLRARHDGAASRFLVVDYKTNWLGPSEEALTAWPYRPEALAAAMQQDHYPLQALLYMVALHRYLRWRLPGYDPAVNLGGVLYLFLRGMTGPDVPLVGGLPCGVFSWATPPSLVTSVSDLLDAGSVE